MKKLRLFSIIILVIGLLVATPLTSYADDEDSSGDDTPSETTESDVTGSGETSEKDYKDVSSDEGEDGKDSERIPTSAPVDLDIITEEAIAGGYADTLYSPSSTDIEIELTEVRSFIKEYFMGVFHKTLSTGATLLDDEEDRSEINSEIFMGDSENYYSLYDRFGGDLWFSHYLGEMEVKTGIADKIYSAVILFAESELSAKSLYDLVGMEDTIYSNQFYQQRAPLKKDGEDDPRVLLYETTTANTSGGDFELGVGNFFLFQAKALTDLTGFFVSDDIVESFYDLFSPSLEEGEPIPVAFATIVKYLLGIFTGGVIIFLVKGIWDYLRNGNGSLKRIFIQLVVVLLDIGLILAISTNPTLFMNLTKTLMSFGETITAEAFSTADREGNEVYASEDPDNVIKAALWQDSIFKPWVNAEFNTEYENLYTKDSGKDKTWELKNDAYDRIGDIVVPRGGDGKNDVRNYAALAYSTHSVYHIPAMKAEWDQLKSTLVENAGKDDAEMDENLWPIAPLAGKSNYIYIDDFRWIDASLKVGHVDDTKGDLSPYKDFRTYQSDVLGNAVRAMWMSFLLLPLLIIGLKKTINALKCLFNFFGLVFRSLFGVAFQSNDKYGIGSNLRHVILPLVDYTWYCFIIFIGAILYKNLAGGGYADGYGFNDFVVQIAYFAITLYLALSKRFKPQNVSQAWVSAKRLASNVKNSDIRGSMFETVGNRIENAPVNVGDMKRKQKYSSAREALFNKAVSDMKNGNGRSSNGVWLEDYFKNFNANSENEIWKDGYQKVKNDPTKKEVYDKLFYNLKGAPTDDGKFRELFIHRFGDDTGYNSNFTRAKDIDAKTRRKWDNDYFGIPIDLGIRQDKEHSTNYSGGKRDYSRERQNSEKDPTRLKDELLQKKMAKARDNFNKANTIKDVDERKKALKKVKKEVNNIKLDGKANDISKILNQVTGSTKFGGTSLIQLDVKLKILIAIIIIYLVIMILCGLFGV